MRTLMSAAALLGMTSIAGANGLSSTVTFDDGYEGWQASGPTSIFDSGGNPGAFAQTTATDTFGLTWSTTSNQNFLGDFSKYASVTVSIDFKVDSINMLGNEVPRDLVVDFRNSSLAQGGLPWTSVWYNLGTLQGGQDWTTYSITFDPNAELKPEGWGGYGAEDPDTFEPILPDGVTFADVLTNVDELAFTTFVPGFFYGFTNFDVGVDNISIEATPIPAPAGLALLAGLGFAGRRRRHA